MLRTTQISKGKGGEQSGGISFLWLFAASNRGFSLTKVRSECGSHLEF